MFYSLDLDPYDYRILLHLIFTRQHVAFAQAWLCDEFLGVHVLI